MPPQMEKVKFLAEEDLKTLQKKVQAKMRNGYSLIGPLQYENNLWIITLAKIKVGL